MITNDAELAVVQKQRNLAEGALASLRREVLPKSKRNYEIFAEGYIEQIARLREEIDLYLGITLVTPPKTGGKIDLATVDVVLDVHGSAGQPATRKAAH